jgi:hypothetical protein
MANVNAKCPNCGKDIVIDDNKDANICPVCKEAFITEKAIKLYKEKTENNLTPNNENKSVKKRHVWKSLGKGLLMALECIGYLFYCLFFVWLFVDITDNIKKK